MTTQTKDIISLETVNTLDALFWERVRRTPEYPAYRWFHKQSQKWEGMTWAEMGSHVIRWQESLKRGHLTVGDRVAIWLGNCPEWVMLDQAALGLGLVVVPLYLNDRPENVAYILRDAGVKLLCVEKGQYWKQLLSTGEELKNLTRVLSLQPLEQKEQDLRIFWVEAWLAPDKGVELKKSVHNPDDLATIVYTSGTTGNPKGVKLSHNNILWNVAGGLEKVSAYREDLFLSFLPLSHTFERTVGYYMPIMAGSTVAYARSVSQLSEDLETVRPTILISVPRVFERIYSKIKGRLEEKKVARTLFEWAVKVGWNRFLHAQKRRGWSPSFLLWPLLNWLVAGNLKKRMGGCLRLTVSGGAALPPTIGKVFNALGLPILQGYGLTETSPVISCNTLQNNDPSGVGQLLKDVEVRTGEKGELLVKSPGVMKGYWNNSEATSRIIDTEGWFHTGDKAKVERGHVYITGRIKEIIVLGNGEKVPPADIEMAIVMDPLIEQVMIVGEGKPYLAALVVLHEELGAQLFKKLELDPGLPDIFTNKRLRKLVVGHISRQMHAFPGYAKVRRVALLPDFWTVENGLLTPTLKLRRNCILERYREEVVGLYEGHEV